MEHQGTLYGFCSAAARQRFTAAQSEILGAAAAAVVHAPHLRQLFGLPAVAQVRVPELHRMSCNLVMVPVLAPSHQCAEAADSCLLECGGPAVVLSGGCNCQTLRNRMISSALQTS